MEKNVGNLLTNLSEDEAKTLLRIEKEMLSQLKTELNSDTISFLEDAPKLSNEELYVTYEDLYSVVISLERKNKQNFYLDANITKNLTDIPNNPIASLLMIDLTFNQKGELISWSRDAFNVLKKYFDQEDCVVLRKVRFDFTFEDRTRKKLALLYLPFESIKISKNKTGDFIDLKAYLKSHTIDLEALANLPHFKTNNQS